MPLYVVSQQAHSLRPSQRCISFVEGTRCSNQCLPMTRHCVSRILYGLICCKTLHVRYTFRYLPNLTCSSLRLSALNQGQQFVVAVGFRQRLKSNSSHGLLTFPNYENGKNQFSLKRHSKRSVPISLSLCSHIMHRSCL